MIMELLNSISGIFYLLLHVTGAGSFPRSLTSKEERECLEKMEKGDEEARDKLIKHNLRLVAHIIKKYYANTNDQEDLISIGSIGLIKAIDTFDRNKGIRLSSYASRCIDKTFITLRLL
jgi:RNA polymerase sigma factor, sigma-70 family